MVARDNYFFLSDDDDKAWILMLKAGSKIVSRYVYSGETKGFIFYFKDDMTPCPFNECWGGWKVTFMVGGYIHHKLNIASHYHTYFWIDVEETLEKIEAEVSDTPILKLSWLKGPPTIHWLQLLSLLLCFMFYVYINN